MSKAGNEQKREWSLQDFDVGKQLGKGRFGVTFMAREKKSKFVVAMKIIFHRINKVSP